MSRSSELTVRLPADLHARPAGLIARAAAGFRSSVVLAADGRDVDARSVLLVMSLGATKGTDVTIRASGEDAEASVRQLAEMLAALAPFESPTPG
jgi:phosphocarrier protein HPr